jgi:REP element-mobilizing transposase RayT
MSTNFPLAYHITFGTYGRRLHGDSRGTVDRSRNNHGDPIIGSDPSRWEREETLLRFEPVDLSVTQRQLIELVLPQICERGGWIYHVGAAKPDHIHVLLGAKRDGEAVRKWLKRWLGEHLSIEWPLASEATWWAECGSVKWVWEEQYFANIFDYITKQRITPAP